MSSDDRVVDAAGTCGLNTSGNATKSNLKPSECFSVWLTGSQQYHAPKLSLAVPGHCGRQRERRGGGGVEKELISKLTISLVLDRSQCGRPAGIQNRCRATTSLLLLFQSGRSWLHSSRTEVASAYKYGKCKGTGQQT